ncbi:MAG: sugar phosphotransferase [Leptospira sp.]|nr:sugar phosphotransferase [Leptospira sp.]
MNRSFLIILAILAIFSLILHAIYVFGRLGVRDIPNERSLHTEITKKSGGMIFIPYFLLLFFLWGFLSQFGYLHSFPFPNENFTFKLLIFGTIFFCLLGFADDIFHLSPKLRLVLEFGFAFVWIYLVSPNISLFGMEIHVTWLKVLFLGFVMVFVVNLVNFMDGLDLYLVGTTALSIYFWIPIFSLTLGFSNSYILILLLLLVSLSGFSFFNFPKAKLFMGDSGSLALGFLLFALPLILPRQNIGTFEISLLFFLFPVFWIDGIITLIIRAYQDKHVFSAHKEHLYQLLTETKLGKTKTCLLVCLSNIPAYISFSYFRIHQSEFLFSEFVWVIMTVIIYMIIYILVRIGLHFSRKNLA